MTVKVGNNTILLSDFAGTPKIVDANGKDISFTANIIGTKNADNISTRLAATTIDALGGNDTAELHGANSSVNAGDGDDTLENDFRTSTNVSINGGNGNDKIYNGYYHNYSGGGSNVSILGGNGTAAAQATTISTMPPIMVTETIIRSTAAKATITF